MDDLDLDRELQAALAVNPSPEFVARVRAKIAEAPPPSMFAGWLKPAAALACGAVVAIAIGMRQERAPETQPGATSMPEIIVSRHIDPPPVGPAKIVAAPPKSTVGQTFRSSKPVAKEPPLPQVIVAPEDVEALQQFVAGASELRFVASFDETPPSTPWVVSDLSIAPIFSDSTEPTTARNN